MDETNTYKVSSVLHSRRKIFEDGEKRLVSFRRKKITVVKTM